MYRRKLRELEKLKNNKNNIMTVGYNRNKCPQLTFYSIVLLVTFITIFITAYNYPLFPLQPDSLSWCYNWLIATVIDYYGTALCLCGVILSSEDKWSRGLAWTAGVLLLGSPLSCLWVLTWLLKGGGSLRLVEEVPTYGR